MYIVWFEDPRCSDAKLVGGKGASLSRLYKNFNVPNGFCVTVDGMEYAPSSADLKEPILNSKLCELISVAYKRLGQLTGKENPPVAIRSSAVGEDGEDCSFAGQYESYLNVIGEQKVIAAVEKCVTSSVSARANSYREKNCDTDMRIAVAVQFQVLSDVSGVVFSANPITGNRSEIIINSSWGLGESIVGGTVTPDMFTICKHDHVILERNITEKHIMTVAVHDGTKEVGIPKIMRNKSSLSSEQIKELTELAIRLEKYFNHPVDLEFAYAKNELFVLQCRPITTKLIENQQTGAW